MKSFISTITVILAITLVIAAIPTESEAKIYEDTIRLHILANSDSEEDQVLKIKIRDAVLEKYSTHLSGYDSIEAAEAALGTMIHAIENDVDGWISDLGYNYGCNVYLSDEWYDTRFYGDFALPEGEYLSLRIVIGEGEGQNWWCVMFPPMCLDIATDNANVSQKAEYTKEEERLISTRGYSVKFKILELASSAVSKVSKKG